MRTYRSPKWVQEQDGIAQARGFAYVKQYNGKGNFSKIVWKNSWRIVDEMGKKNLFELEIDQNGSKKKFVFDAEEFMRWLAYA